ncbi:MAG: orotate phosphoribosyltransferase [Saprospiraceae bacterium]|nr:orotate phosphoribosyltransferase [Saprospiraceae bacterium]
MTIAHKIADRLLEIQSVKLNPGQAYTWASGLKSPIYCDNRKVLSYPKIRSEIVDGFVSLANQYPDTGAIAGVATAGIAWGALLAEHLNLPFCYVRSKPKEHGLKNMIEGHLEPGAKVLVIEDLISTGGSSIEACQAILAGGFQIEGVLAIFQYEFGIAKQKFAEKSLKFQSLSHFTALLEQALLHKIITSNEYENLKSWNLDPQKWSEDYQLKQLTI